MTWESDESDSAQKWPTWGTRRNWARNNYTKYSLQQRLQRFLVMAANLTVLNDLIEEEGSEQLLTPKQKKQFREMYETFRPTRPVGRPKNGSESGPSE